MRIGIDISQIVYGTGVSNYTKNLVAALLKIDKENDYVLFGGSIRRRMELLDYNAKVFPLSPTIADFVWNRLHVLPVELLIGKVDVFHSSDWTQPPSRAFKVTTIHDLAPLRFPNSSHPKIVAVHRRRLEWVKKEVDKIIAVSQFTKKEIVELLDISSDRIVVIPEAADPRIKPVGKKEIDEVKKKYKIKDHYFLVVGRDPRKNLPAIVQAYDQIMGSAPEAGWPLVVVGEGYGEVPQSILENVIELGHVAKDDMPALYSGAISLIYTSLYEGFGLPILEAMQAGCPVVTSNIGSMKEIAGDAVVLVDPTNPTQIANGIDKALSKRSDWIKKGKKRAKEFSWEKTARETLGVYKQSLQRPRLYKQSLSSNKGALQ